MNLENEIDDIIELLQNQYKLSLKYSANSNEYRVGMAAGLKIGLGAVQDLKEKMKRAGVFK